jgi:hypothetical protein
MRLAPVDEKFQSSTATLYGYGRSDSPGKTKVGADWQGAKYGEIYVRGATRRMAFAVEAGSGGQIRRVVIDADLDGDLSNDTAIDCAPQSDTAQRGFRRAGQIVLSVAGRKETLDVRVVDNSQVPVVMLSPAQWLVGETELGGKRLRAALIDDDHDGVYRSGDTLLLDLNGDGSFSSVRTSDGTGEMLNLAPYLRIDGAYYVPRVAPDGTTLAFDLYRGPTGLLAITGQAAEALKGGRLTLYLRSGNDAGGFQVNAPVDAPLSLPVGDYRSVYLSLSSPPPAASSNGRRSSVGMISASLNIPQMAIAEGATRQIELEKPRMVVTVTQQGNQLSVNQKTAADNGIAYSQIRVIPASGRSTGPAVVVARAAKPDEAIASGNMEYG